MKSAALLPAILLAATATWADATFELYTGKGGTGHMIEKITFPYYDRGNIDGQCIQPTETVQSVHVYEGTDGGPGSHSDIEADYCIYVFATDTSCLGKVDKMHPYVAGNYGPTTFDDVASLVIRKHACPADEPSLIPL